MRIRFLLGNIALLVVLLSATSADAENPGPLRLEKEIPLPGVEGRIDHFSADEHQLGAGDNAAVIEARKTTALAISSGWPTRPPALTRRLERQAHSCPGV